MMQKWIFYAFFLTLLWRETRRVKEWFRGYFKVVNSEEGMAAAQKEGADYRIERSQTNRTFSPLSENNAAFNNGCLDVLLGGREDRKWLAIDGDAGRNLEWTWNGKDGASAALSLSLSIPLSIQFSHLYRKPRSSGTSFKRPVAFSDTTSWRSTCTSFIEVDDIRHDILPTTLSLSLSLSPCVNCRGNEKPLSATGGESGSLWFSCSIFRSIPPIVSVFARLRDHIFTY